MGFITEILAYIGKLAVQIISFLGYPGVFILMALESMVFPMPSELVMPFAGFLIAQGKMSWLGVIIASSLGSIAGSLLSYYIGFYGGETVVLKFGKYLLLEKEDLEKTHKWFIRRGDITVLISRFIPVVRHLISIPAGIGKMELKKFCVYTIIGATLWNTILAYAGFILGQNWDKIKHYSSFLSISIAIVVLIAGIYMIHRHVKHKLKKK
jgi:membrane protein DedA with SNARE-associated domain